MLGGGFGSGTSWPSRSLVFSVRQTSHIGIPALRVWHLLTIFHSMVGMSEGSSVVNSQNLLDSVVPALDWFFKSCLWLEYLSLKVLPVLPQ